MLITHFIYKAMVYTVVMPNKTQEIINKFSDQIRKTVLEYDEKEKIKNREIASLRKRNRHLLDKLTIEADRAEVDSNELYLVDKIERLEEDLRNCEHCKRVLQSEKSVDKQ